MKLDSLSPTLVALLLPMLKGSTKDRQERSTAGERKEENREVLAGGMSAPGREELIRLGNCPIIVLCKDYLKSCQYVCHYPV